MSGAIEHIKANLVGYLLPVAAMLMWAGVVAFMDARHDKHGSAETVRQKAMQADAEMRKDTFKSLEQLEIRALKRERRKLVNYERLAPNSQYSASRQAEIDALTDEIQELEN